MSGLSWFGGTLIVYTKGPFSSFVAQIAEIKGVTFAEAQEILDRSYPASKYTAIFTPSPISMEAQS